MIGGIAFGTLLQRIGRKWSIVIGALLALPVLPLWAFSTTPVMLMQICAGGVGRGAGL